MKTYFDDEKPETVAWTCPHCQRPTTITENDRSVVTARVPLDTADAPPESRGVWTRAITTVCPNPDCKRLSISFHYGFWELRGAATHPFLYRHDPSCNWNLVPPSSARSYPSIVPAPIRDDYTEACLIQDLSPKAAATLCRRALQGMIRDYWGISERTLKQEVDALEGRVTSETWTAIDAIRTIGNIGAHMEKDIDLIIEVDPDEALLLRQLIEYLIDDWYVARANRESTFAKIKTVADSKRAAKSAPSMPG